MQLRYYRGTNLIIIFLMILTLIGCENAESARKELGKRSISFDENQFITTVKKGDIEAVKLFVKAGMHPNVKVKGETALAAAVDKGNLEMVRLLIKSDADVNRAC